LTREERDEKEEKKIIAFSDQILNLLLEYRKEHPGFKFWLRSKDSPRDQKKRLEKGQWFQGSDYIFLGFYRASGHINMTRSIGWVLWLDKELNPKFRIEVVWPEEKNQKLIDIYKEIASKFGCREMSPYKYYLSLPDETIEKSLTDFINNYLLRMDEIIKAHGADELFFIPEADFERKLVKVISIRKNKITTDTLEHNKEKQSTNHSNTIFFGPPGTGKTYNSVNKALGLLGDAVTGKNRSEIKALFDKRIAEGRIQFTTFHQSMSYEDFIEGIKPRVLNEQIVYEVEDGIFKKICDAARVISGNLEEVLEDFKKDISELDGKKPHTIHAQGTSFDIIYRGTGVFYVQPHNSIKKDPWYPVNIQNIRKVHETGNYFNVYNPTYVREILNHLKKEYSLKRSTETNGKAALPYVLIIDEINRGNIAQIFGELITLIEDDKREGGKEAMTSILPYSKEPFSIPSNLYIIGTMNTVDRSVEALDTALRRRFVFEAKDPQPQLLTPGRMIWQLWWDYSTVSWTDSHYRGKEEALNKLLGVSGELNDEEKKEKLWQSMKGEGPKESQAQVLDSMTYDGIDLSRLLQFINHRIEKLLGKDYRIGHAYFIKIGSLSDLKLVFIDQIIPLLQEYFYGDHGRIGLILGAVFVAEGAVGQKIDLMRLSGYDMGDLNETKVYRVVDLQSWSDFDFIKNVKAVYGE
jgi:5-methylcytosine-specific restriction endonuclease McrBC GTP-binding regulatory subunit McrB